MSQYMARFSKTNRAMVESMAATAERIRSYEMKYGTERVETFIDAVLAIQEHVDPDLVRPYRPNRYDLDGDGTMDVGMAAEASQTGYEDLWELERKSGPEEAEPQKPIKFPPKPEKDILWFIQEYSAILEAWQRDILTMLRDEMLYFWPQMETKTMNEGWASFSKGAYANKLSMNDLGSSGELLCCVYSVAMVVS